MENTFSIRTEITRRSLYYHGISGRFKCIYYWYKFRKNRKGVSLTAWLNEPLAYTLESNHRKDIRANELNRQIEREFERYLVSEVPHKN